ncbi:MAG: hypothetical protein IJL74_00490 [Bacilli bacterium]|nr:hypothetical protein [Bacilli bacterium]
MSKSIKLKDDTYIDSTGVVHNRDLLSDILENINNHLNTIDSSLETNAMTICLSANKSIGVSSTWTYYYMQFDTVDLRLGDKLSFEGYSVKIGAGVHHVRVSANIMFEGINGYCVAGVRKGSNWISEGYYRQNTTAYGIVSLSPKIISVNQGDLINMGFGASATGTMVVAGGPYTYLHVEVID